MGLETVLINPNIATIQTSKGLADKVYYLPVNEDYVEQILAKEKPDAIALAFGARHCALPNHVAHGHPTTFWEPQLPSVSWFYGS